MEMKPHRKSLGRNPLSDAISILGMLLNRQGSGHHPLGGAPYLDLDMVLNEQELGHHILSDALHHLPGAVKNEQGSLHLTRQMQRVRKLAEPRKKGFVVVVVVVVVVIVVSKSSK
jgi:hypothetical protein